MHNISDCWPRGMHNFDFIINWSGTSSFNTFCVWFFKNTFLTLYYINWPNFMCIAIIFCPACNVINVKISRGLVIKTFSYMTKKWGQKNVNISRTSSCFNISFFIIIKGLSLKLRKTSCMEDESSALNILESENVD